MTVDRVRRRSAEAQLNARHGAPASTDYAVADGVLADAGFRSPDLTR
jgi:hypothetical protein